jgi:hypothetical protein
MSLFSPPDDQDSTSRRLDPSSLDHNAPSDSRSAPQEPGQGNNCGEGNFTAGGSTTLEALYATDVVREAFMRLFNRDRSGHIFLDSDNGSDDNEDWEDNMDPLTFARYYAGPSNPHFVNIVQDHDRETRARFDRGMKSWAQGVAVSADFDLGAY